MALHPGGFRPNRVWTVPGSAFSGGGFPPTPVFPQREMETVLPDPPDASQASSSPAKVKRVLVDFSRL